MDARMQRNSLRHFSLCACPLLGQQKSDKRERSMSIEHHPLLLLRHFRKPSTLLARKKQGKDHPALYRLQCNTVMEKINNMRLTTFAEKKNLWSKNNLHRASAMKTGKSKHWRARKKAAGWFVVISSPNIYITTFCIVHESRVIPSCK